MKCEHAFRINRFLKHAMPHGGFLTRLRADALAWLGHLKGAPALATLLVGTGFLAGNFTYRYQVAHEVKPSGPVHIYPPGGGVVANVTSITQTPNSELVQVHYNRVVPETMEGARSRRFAIEASRVRMSGGVCLSNDASDEGLVVSQKGAELPRWQR